LVGSGNVISDAEKLDVENAITKAENKTSAEIVAVIARASDGYHYIPYLWAALIALAVPWPLIYRTWMPVQDIYLIQIGVFVALALILHYPDFRFALVPRSVMRSHAHQRAMQQFVAQDIYTTAGHTGVLLFVSVAERYAEIVVDYAVHQQVPDEEWKSIIDELTADIGRGLPAKGLIKAIGRIGEHLAAHFPPSAAKENLLPNHLVMLDAE
jgi:putative membrane protein